MIWLKPHGQDNESYIFLFAIIPNIESHIFFVP